MSEVLKQNQISVEEFLSGELVSEFRHEFVDGQVFAMAGASMNHNRISANLIRHLGNHLAGTPCEVFNSDMMLKTTKNRYRYPDVMVSCDSGDENEIFLDNAVLLIEIISQGTRKTDKEVKRLEYLQLSSLLEYVLIEQDFVEIEVLRRSAGWQPSYYYLGDEVFLESVNLTLPAVEVYERVVNKELSASFYK
ncbi:MAG: Uma2 family endonuclease [Thiolinea sp.]